jgi:Sulfotransferase family
MFTVAKIPDHHQPDSFLGWLRKPLRNTLFALLAKVSHTDDAKEMAATTLSGLLSWRPDGQLNAAAAGASPYPDLGETAEGPAARTDVVFISARFRTGSTLLWNLFRNIDGVTAYYEPLNERRWFDPAVRGDRLDTTHRQVSNYWKEYEGLEELGEYYTEEWISRNLYMGPTFWAPEMKRYIEILIERAKGRPVLQFNRVDFRLPWLRRNFPGAKIIHLFRHPRDQWCSSLMGDAFPLDGSIANFVAHDRFYLLNWARDLKYHFPFLAEHASTHPYQLFYYLWKLSYLFGRTYAHHSLAFEHLLASPRLEMGNMFSALNLRNAEVARLLSLVEKPSQGQWHRYADDDWFRRQESACEENLRDFFAQDRMPPC